MNQVSDNYYAETLIKGLGARFGGARHDRRRRERRAGGFARELGVGARVVDGSGLSRGNAISPAAVGRLLHRRGAQPWFDSFYRSLPLAGRSGTLTQADARHRRDGPLPGEDGHADRGQRTGRLLPLPREPHRSRSRS